MAYQPLKELILARAREFYREPEAIFWVFVVPILLAVGLGIAFRGGTEDPLRVLVEEGSAPPTGLPGPSPSPLEVAARLSADPRLRVEVKPPEECRRALAGGRVDLVVAVGEGYRYSYDPQWQKGALARSRVDEALQRAEGRRDLVPTSDQVVSEPGTRYIDFLIPGLIGMNIMGGGLWGVGFVIVDMRVRKLMKRFLATPMHKRDFLLSVVGSRMLFLVPEITLLILVGRWGFGVPQRGATAAVAVIVLLSALCFSGVGLLVAARAQKIETVSGLMNVVMLPMWILSGIFFSAQRFPDPLQPVIQALPLTATIDALRAVMLEGSSLVSQGTELSILATWGLGSFALSLKWFRWL